MENYKAGLKTSIITIIINTILATIKIAAGIIGNSAAVLADGVHTLADILTTIVVIIGLKVSSKAPDDSHPYGHEKYELIFAKLLSIVLALTGIFIGYNGFKLLMSGEIQIPGQIALFAALLSIIVKEGMYRYTLKTAKKIKSFSMEADAWHHRSDAFSSIGTFIGVLGARLGIGILDPIAAIIVSVLIVKVGVDLYLKSVRSLVDESVDAETLKKIKTIILSVNEVIEIKSLKTRISGNTIAVDTDITVDGNMTVAEGHDVAEKVYDLVVGNIEDVKHCMVHVEPYTPDTNKVEKYKEEVLLRED